MTTSEAALFVGLCRSARRRQRRLQGHFELPGKDRRGVFVENALLSAATDLWQAARLQAVDHIVQSVRQQNLFAGGEEGIETRPIVRDDGGSARRSLKKSHGG